MAIYIPTGQAIEDGKDHDGNEPVAEYHSEPPRKAPDEDSAAIFRDCGSNI